MMKVLLFSPELFFVTMAAVFFGLSLQRKVNARSTYVMAVALASVGVLVAVMSAKLEGMLFFDSYRVDFFSQVFKVLIALGTFLVIFVCDELKGVEDSRHPEFYFLISICTLGMMMLVSAVELLTVYISLELSSYTLYLLVPMRRGLERNDEAAIKYFMIGACASALMIFGISYLFGVTHTTYIADMIRVLPTVIAQPAAVIGLI
ncbi:MAG TPA: NADH-quinone oxidoreductase subunit N, partial [Syntrophobacteraceae bacterium]|nr:NADH-quinone oxidoreductase subunit N [Syntrophobacteraceae bacterium]